MNIRKCLWCDNELKGDYRGDKKYCNVECRKAHYKVLNPIKPKENICEKCGKKFNTSKRPSKFCSLKCRNDYKNKKNLKEPIEKKCVVCDGIFSTSHPGTKTCCSECSKINKNRAVKKYYKTEKGSKIKKEQDKKYKKKHGKPSKKLHHKFNGRKIDYSITLIRLIEKDNNICHICGYECDSNDFIEKDGTIICGDNYPSIDHVIPASKGGEHTWDNVKLAHRRCNYIKGDSLL